MFIPCINIFERSIGLFIGKFEIMRQPILLVYSYP